MRNKTGSKMNIEYFQRHPILNRHSDLLEYVKRVYSDNDYKSFIIVPGRVNLIGEHVDYNHGPVLPCAIDREIIFYLTKTNSGIVKISNINPDYKEVTFSVRDPIEPYEKGNWGNYLKAGVKGIVDSFNQNNTINPEELCGFNAVISSTLPAAAGLSSSSSLVVGAALAILAANDMPIDKLNVAEICAEAEHFVGTAGGGMDHAAILLGKKDSFLKINFNPLRTLSVPAPDDIDIILFHSLVEAEKSSHVREEYNRRVLECHLALDQFNRFISDRLSNNLKPLKFLGEISAQYFNITASEMDSLISEFINSLPESYSLQELLQLFNNTADELTARYRHALRDGELREFTGGFKLKGRFRHVYSECQRVETATTYLQHNEKVKLGKLLLASHKSLAEDYEVSTPEVDSIVNLLDGFGAYGCRIVGAGFGGMVLAISDRSKSDVLIERMKESFYSNKISENLDQYIIRCKTADGAGVLSE